MRDRPLSIEFGIQSTAGDHAYGLSELKPGFSRYQNQSNIELQAPQAGEADRGVSHVVNGKTPCIEPEYPPYGCEYIWEEFQLYPYGLAENGL